MAESNIDGIKYCQFGSVNMQKQCSLYEKEADEAISIIVTFFWLIMMQNITANNNLTVKKIMDFVYDESSMMIAYQY